MKNLINFLFLSILFCYNTKAQEFKLGKVSIAELEQKVHTKDTAAVAAILFKTGSTKFEYMQGEGFRVITEVAMRIKIYKKDGYDLANQEVRFISGNSSIKESVLFADAVTYNLVEGKIEKTKLKSEGEFNEKINKYWSKKKITLPNVKEGSILEFRYRILTNNIGMLRQFDFQTDIPIDYSEYKTYVPEYFIYNTKMKGFVTPQIDVVKSPKSFMITSKERTMSAHVSSTNFSSDKIEYQEAKTTYVTRNMPAMKEEAFVNNIDNYTTSLEQELSMTKYPNEPFKSYSTDWEAVVKTIYEDSDFGIELNKTGYFEDDLKAVLAGLTTQDEIILAVLNYVKSNVKWNEYNGYSCDNGVKKAYTDKTGNVAEINLMLTAMLRTAGLKANPVLVSTRANGISIFPNRGAFNYVIAAVETSEGKILLDATSKFSTPNVLPFRDLNWMGRLIRKDGTSEEVDLMPTKASNDYVTMMYAIDATGKITGKLRRQRTGHNAMSFRSEVENTKEEEYLEKLENENEKIEIYDYSRVNEKDVQLPIVESCSFTGTNLCEIIGEKMYVNPLLFFTKEHNPFKQEIREYPIDYGFPFLDKYTISIDIPEGYVVETLPKSSQLSMENNIGSFKFISNASGNKIQLSITHQINASIVSSEYYSTLKEYYQGMIAKETEKIVLKKV
ncbi:MAG TPA: transglutaminase domain-containing protein [Flavobacterium sp.]|uniref:transglutaminase domain-containing protein n=1 Tax=Flavobacterium sp. TaxID=239 RepID=UPI002DB77F1A|nr:transglutaminase domain-containing protein [Flavobacterium sp.]HEU4791902.1 transglutaminase domain-containing protein [Flavobacterium sp.]